MLPSHLLQEDPVFVQALYDMIVWRNKEVSKK
jgi:hypothetical protein